MKTYLSGIILLFFLLAGCQNENDTAVETWWINSSRVECKGVGLQVCFQIQKNQEILADSWQYFYNEIKGFDYKPGNIYQIKVRITPKPEPVPADASSLEYELVEVVSKTAD